MHNNKVDVVSLTKALGKDTLTYVPAKIIPGVFALLSVAIFTRIFSPSEYGQYMIVLTTSTIAVALLSQWITQSALRYRASYVLKDKAGIFNRNFIVILSVLSLIICAAALAFLPLRGSMGVYERLYGLTLMLILSQVWYDSIIVIFQADLRAKSFSIYAVLNAFLKLGLSITFVLIAKKDIIALLWGTCIAYVLMTVPMLMMIHHHPSTSPTAITNHEVPEKLSAFLKRFMNYGFPMIGWYLGAQLLSISDRYLLQAFRTSEEVGIYSSNYNLVASAIAFISMPLLTAAHPLLMNAGERLACNREEVQNLITVFSRYYLIVALPIITFVIVLSRDIANVFLGAAYRAGNAVLPIVLCGLFAWYFAMFGHKGLEFREKTNVMFLYVMICTAVKIILNVIFIPIYGYMAAAIATLVCFFMYPVMVYFDTRSDIKWVIPWKSLARILLCSAILAVSLFVIRGIRLNSLILLALSTFVMIIMYASSLLVVGEITPRELAVVRRFISAKKHTEQSEK